MIVSDRYRFVFVHIPKCGGTSVRSALEKYDERADVYFSRGRDYHDELGFLDYHHIPLAVLREHFKEDFDCVRRYESFALTRDPVARFPSSLSERLIWRGKNPHLLSTREIAREVDEVIEYFSSPSLELPVRDPDFIHFARQVDYTHLDGERVVKRVYPINRLQDLLYDIGDLTGISVDILPPKNERLSYTSRFLQHADSVAQGAIMAIVPRRIWKPVFHAIKGYFIRFGVVKRWRSRHSRIFESAKVIQFIGDFYADDILLYEEAQSRTHLVKTR